MRIMMMTNTFTPHLGGVARSVESFTAAYRHRGHRVMVVAPVFADQPHQEEDVIRMPAIQHFNGSDFSVIFPHPGFLKETVEQFRPDIIHSHHPFLLGGTALRLAHGHRIPLVFTHHTQYEQYTHYIPGDSKLLKQFAIRLSTSYANLCDQVFAPSESIAELLRQRGVATPIDVVPTGVTGEQFRQGSGEGFRAAMGIPADAFVVGHLGRLAPEKNISFLTEAVAAFVATAPTARFLVVGQGPAAATIKNIFLQAGLESRLHLLGFLPQPLLASAYQAMDLFAFASTSETQGLVLTEAMAAGVPVVGLDAPGVREVVREQVNGRLLYSASVPEFVSALQWVRERTPSQRQQLVTEAKKTAHSFEMSMATEKAITLYQKLCHRQFIHREEEYSPWAAALTTLKSEWELLKGITRSPPLGTRT